MSLQFCVKNHFTLPGYVYSTTTMLSIFEVQNCECKKQGKSLHVSKMSFTMFDYCIELLERQVFILSNPICISEAKLNKKKKNLSF